MEKMKQMDQMRVGSTACMLLLGLALSMGLSCGEGRTVTEPQEEGTPSIIALPAPRYSSAISVEEAIFGRRSIRRYKDEPLTLQEISQLLWAAGGQTIDGITGASRSYPSAGGLYPLEIYLAGASILLLEAGFGNEHLYEDKSLFKASGPVWHQKDRKAHRIPQGLRRLDQDASWSKSDYHGWVYEYGLHLTCSEAGFPKLVQVETASVSESQVLHEKEAILLSEIGPETLTGDNSYTKAMRIRRWAKAGVALISPAVKWTQGRYAKAYHRFLQQPENQALLRTRRTAIEPIFDLIAKLIDATDNHKQLSIQGLRNVRTHLALGVFALQIAMISNSMWGMPLRTISHMMSTLN